jgi:ribonuclease Y
MMKGAPVNASTVLIAVFGALILGVLLVMLRLLLRSGRGHSATATRGHASSLTSGSAGSRGTSDADAAMLRQAELHAESLRATAQLAADEMRERADLSAEHARSLQAQAENEVQAVREQRADLERRERRLGEREERLDAEARTLEDRALELGELEQELDRKKAELLDIEADRRASLERVAGLTAERARAELIATIENDAKLRGAIIARDIEREAHETGEARARRILTTVIQRLASEQTAESVVSVLHLPGDEMKGRIIGREGRNIRAFEQITGVNLIIDDTPEAVLLSCFDPVRRETARLALQELVFDGRIHPSRIEEAYERSTAEVERQCKRAGEDALVEVGITEMHPELVHTLGQLRYRTSYGQNVLKHLLESSFIAGMMADELGLDRALCMRAALLHDIGKAMTHLAEGSHAIVGAELARRLGESDDVVHAIEAHHNEVEPRTVEAVLTQAADAISGGRPGARRESLEAYVKRLERLEEIAMEKLGVEKVFAMQAGREVRVMVLPDAVDDIQAQILARDIAKQVEEELTYPGQIRVTVIRESRSTEVAR